MSAPLSSPFGLSADEIFDADKAARLAGFDSLLAFIRHAVRKESAAVIQADASKPAVPG